MRKCFCIFRSEARALLVASVLVGALGTSCLPRGTDEAGMYRPIAAAALTRVEYSTVKEQVLTPKCIRCHSNYGTEAGLAKDLVPGNPSASPLYRTMAQGTMPPGGPRVSDSALGLVRSYISQYGAAADPVPGQQPLPLAEPSATPSPVPAASGPESAVDFAAVKRRVLTPSCVACHGDMDTEQGLAAYVTAGDPEHSSLYLAVKGGTMPPTDPKLDDEQVGLVRTYIEKLKQ